MTRLSVWILRAAPFALTVACVVWIMAQSPFAAPMVARSTAQVQANLDRALAREVSLGWLLPRLQNAIIAQDLQQLDLLVGLANDHAIALPGPMIDDIAALDAAASGMIARTAACGACAIDITACATLAQIGTCALPFELTPAGDLNAIRRAGVSYIDGQAIDQLDVGLAIIGLGATGAVVATGGTSYSLKAGTSVLRMARRLGTLTSPFTARLSSLVTDAVHWERMGEVTTLRAAPGDLIRAAKLDELTGIATSLRRVSTNTSVGETLSLLRHVDNAQDAARLARISDAMGPKTRGAFDVLGKRRVFQALVRVSDLAVGAALALYALGLQVALFASQQCGNACLRHLRQRLTRHTI